METFPIVEARQSAAEPVAIVAPVIGHPDRPRRFPTQQRDIVNTRGDYVGCHRAAERAGDRDFGVDRRRS